jgi:hypothetical protein
VEYYALARYDLHITMEEFWSLTPTMFKALCRRRNVGIRYNRYAAAMTASAVYNVNRGSPDAPILTAFDFIRPEEDAIRLQKIRETEQYIKTVIGHLPMTTPREKYLDVRRKVIIDLAASGNADAEELFDRVWPHLKPTPEESRGESHG